MIQPTHRSQGRASALRLSLLVLLAAVPAGYALHASEPGVELRYGPEMPVGQGTARTYVLVSGGVIDEVGVALSEATLHGLPTLGEHHPGAGDGHHGRLDVEYLLEMPALAGLPYRFVELGWNPWGHPPEGIYDRPHFDVHFYTIALEERNAIDPREEGFPGRAARIPAEALAPAGYVPHHVLEGVAPALVTVPRMGMHWVDPGAPEFNGGGFTATMLYGSWDGRFVFDEPMVSRAFLLTRSEMNLPLPRHPSGVSPRTLRVYWDAPTGEHRIALRDLEAR
jgi:hypothetical protein